jgi:hypothetical protein
MRKKITAIALAGNHMARVIDWAKDARKEYLTGTAITVIVVLLILLVAPRGEGRRLLRRCPVCDHTLLSGSKYCSDCGSGL